MKQIYISHAPQDRDSVQILSDHLTRAGFKPYVNRITGPGKEWKFEIADELRNSRAVIVILSQRGADSLYVTYEWAFAVGAGIQVIVVAHRGVNGHPHLSILEQVDFGSFIDEEVFWEQFIRELQRMLGEPDRSPQNKRRTETSTAVLSDSRKYDQALPDQAGYYLIIKHAAHPKQVYRLDAESISLGRDENNDIQIEDTSVSRSHLRFVRSGTGYQVIDLGSTNGTYMSDGSKIDVAKLKIGDVLLIGDSITLSYQNMP